MLSKISKISIYSVISFLALSSVLGAINQGVQPVWALLSVLLLPCLVFALVRFPAAFIPPILFISQGIPMPVNPYGRVFDPTELTLGAVLLTIAVLLRLVRLSILEKGPRLIDLFKNRGKGIAVYLLFAAALSVSYLWTRSPGYGGSKLVSFLTIGTLCFLSPFVLLTEERDFRHLTISTVALGLVLSLSRISGVNQGIYAANYQPVHIGIGQLIGMATLLVLYFQLFEKQWTQKLMILSLPLLAAGLIATETRDAFFSLLLVLLGGAFTSRRTMGRLSPRTALVGVALIVIALLVVPGRWMRGYAAQRLQAKTMEVVQMVKGESTDKGSGGRRLVFYEAAIEGFAEKPLLGWGIGGWETYYWHNDVQNPPEYPHFMVLEVAVEEGLLGLIPLLMFLFISLKAAKRVFDEASGRFAFVLPILAYCILLTTASGDIDDNRFVWLWCGIAFVACRIIESRHQQEIDPETALDA